MTRTDIANTRDFTIKIKVVDVITQAKYVTVTILDASAKVASTDHMGYFQSKKIENVESNSKLSE